VTEHALDRTLCYRALRARDARFDGRFYTAVVSTGIYCRPICPARTPKLENCLFLPSAAAAQQLGFRSCLRCRPELAPGMAAGRGSINTVARALELIAEGVANDGGMNALCDRLGIGTRQLRRLFDRHMGASPVAVAQTQRVLFAKKLLTETSLPMTEIAAAAGFNSVRRFNHALRQTYARPPSALRRPDTADATAQPGVTLKLPFSAPYDFTGILEFLAARAITGVELVTHDSYRRSFALGGAVGQLEVRAADAQTFLWARIHSSDVKLLGAIVTRLRRLFDLDADSTKIDALLVRDPAFKKRVRARAGVRVPGAFDSFELAVRALLGQQVSVRAASTFAARLVSEHGVSLPASARSEGFPERLFPTPEALRDADLTRIGLTGARSDSLRALAAAVARDAHFLEPAATLPETLQRLCALPGVGPWTAQYIAMRALREPDAFPASDLGLLRALETADGRPSAAQLERRSQAWRPYRAYAALRLWSQAGDA
jgi:AraC family transcriptional regulator of adaptative response / DNA-3-methyladenine glycosylase II